MFDLSDSVKRNIERSTGLTVEKIASMSAESVDSHIEKRLGKKLHMATPKDKRLQPRGSVYLAMGRLLSSLKANKELAKI
jgi:hypothetical protein